MTGDGAGDSMSGGSAQTSLEARFAHARLSPSRRQLIRAILDNHEETFFLSSREMAKRYSVDAATIVRTIQALGYERFADFAADLRQHFVTRITPYSILKAATRKNPSVADHVRESIDHDIENLNLLRSAVDIERVIELARLIHRSQQVVVVGVDLAASLAGFLAYGLQPLGIPAEAPVGSAGNLYHKTRAMSDKDLLIAISFTRCLRETVESVQRARERGIPTFGITDTDTTPIARYADNYLVAPISSPAFTGSYTAPISLMNAILAACSRVRPGRALALLREKEEEYTKGARWYQEPQHRAKAQSNENEDGKAAKTKKRG
jgi:DNA-binding MurR/RpiR family transcriptional regulator